MIRKLRYPLLLLVPNLTFDRNPDLFPTLTRNNNGAFPTVGERLSEYAKLGSLRRWTLIYTRF